MYITVELRLLQPACNFKLAPDCKLRNPLKSPKEFPDGHKAALLCH
jgi:hypothetical protein